MSFKHREEFMNVNFSNSVFKEDVSFNYPTFKGETYFFDVKFKKKVTFHTAPFKEDALFCRASFLGEADFLQSSFLKEADFHDVCFEKKANFYSVNFQGYADFTSSQFKNTAYFHNANFSNNTKSSDKEHIADVSFWMCSFKGITHFTHTEFNDSLFFVNSRFHGLTDFYGAKIKNLNLRATIIDLNLYFLGATVVAQNRETYRIIKNEFIKQNNRIEALKYYHKEMRAYQTELTGDGGTLKRFDEKILLFLNMISNYYGQSWILGVVFTLLIGLALFLPLWYSGTTSHDKLSFGGAFLQFIYPAHRFDFLPMCGWGYLYDILGRIFVSFGIYQTIQAFRKYGRF